MGSSLPLSDPRHPNYIPRKRLEPHETRELCEAWKKNRTARTIIEKSEIFGVTPTASIRELERRKLFTADDYSELRDKIFDKTETEKPKPETKKAKFRPAIVQKTDQKPDQNPRKLDDKPRRQPLSPEEVFTIRELYGDGSIGVSQSTLAVEFDTTQATISRVIRYSAPFNNHPFLKEGEEPRPNTDYIHAAQSHRAPALSVEKVHEARYMYHVEDRKFVEIGKTLNVSTSTATKAIKGEPPYDKIEDPIGGYVRKQEAAVAEKPKPEPETDEGLVPQIGGETILGAIHKEYKRIKETSTVPIDEWMIYVCNDATGDKLQNELTRAGLAEWAIHNGKIVNLFGLRTVQITARPSFGWCFRRSPRKG